MTKPFYKVRPIKDLRDLINQSTELYGDRPAFEIKNSKNGHFEITYKRYRNEINCLGTALTDMGLAGEKIAVAGDNCYEWCLSYMATVCGVGVVVPIDRELLFDDINSILNVADVKLLICDGKFASKLDGRRAEMKDDLTIVYMRNEPSEDSLTVAKLLERGQALLDSGDRRYLDAVIDPEAMCSPCSSPQAQRVLQRASCSATGTSAPRSWPLWALSRSRPRTAASRCCRCTTPMRAR